MTTISLTTPRARSAASSPTISPTVSAHSRAGRQTDALRPLLAQDARQLLGGIARMVEGARLRRRASRQGPAIASTIASRGQAGPQDRALDRAAGPGRARRTARARGSRRAWPRAARAGAGASCTATCSRRCRAWGSTSSTAPGRRAARGVGGPDDRDDRDGVRQVDVLQPPDARRALPRFACARAVRVSDQGARAGPGARACGLRAEQARAPGYLRRRHAARGARADPPRRQPRAHEPRHAARRASCPTTPPGGSCSPTSRSSSSTRRTSTAACSARTSPTCCAGCVASQRPTGPSRASCSRRRRSPTRWSSRSG